MRLGLLLVVAFVTACSIDDIPFRCAKDSECVKGGESGVCELAGYCSFADSSCDSGRSYGGHAPSELSGSCVPKCVEQLALGGAHACARRADGRVACWGQAPQGQLGNGVTTLDHSSDPVEVLSVATPASDVSAGDSHTCSVRDGAVWCWGSNLSRQLGVPMTSLDEPGPFEVPFGPLSPKAVQVAAGFAHTCARGGAGVVCWGQNNFGQLGLGYPSEPTDPQPPTKAVDFKAPLQIQDIAAGGAHTCAIPTAGALRCWGNNAVGQVGLAQVEKAVEPLEVKVPASAVALGSVHTCALDKGLVRCWGANNVFQLGADRVGGPLAQIVPLEANAKGLCAGYLHTCALLEDGSLACWGRNDSGQLGPNTDLKPSLPITFSLPEPALEVRCGGQHTCARTEAGRVYCWGSNDKGQLGNGQTSIDPGPEPDPTVTQKLCP